MSPVYGRVDDRAKPIATLTVIELDATLLGTADNYGPHDAEAQLAEAWAGRRAIHQVRRFAQHAVHPITAVGSGAVDVEPHRRLQSDLTCK